MGFLKRLFSIRSKKQRKPRSLLYEVKDEPELRPVPEQEEQEAAVSRLLRSSSARYAVVSEMDYTSLPPLPHPINDLVPAPASSAASIASTGNTQRSTYTITVHRRQHHARAEFPIVDRTSDAFDVEQTDSRQGDNSQLIKLRSDPSVASLLKLYDEHGQLPFKAFSNVPPTPANEGRAQTKRSGSTLRQLLGDPSTHDDQLNCSSAEGDISWAERHLGETESISSASSFVLQTPKDLDTHLPHDHSNIHEYQHDITISTEHELSASSFGNPDITSMEVELSSTTNSSVVDYYFQNVHDNNPYENANPSTPQRASQVFDFLTDKCRSRVAEDNSDRPLPQLPSAFSSPSDTSIRDTHSHFSSDSSSDSISPLPPSVDISEILFTHDTPLQYVPSQQDSILAATQTPISRTPSVVFTYHQMIPNVTSQVPNAAQSASNNQDIVVIVTAPTPSTTHIDTLPTRIPRGPRMQDPKASPLRPTLIERYNSDPAESTDGPSKDLFTPLPSRRAQSQKRVPPPKYSSSLSSHDIPDNMMSRSKSESKKHNKENNARTQRSGLPQLPLTPSLYGSYPQQLFNPSLFQPPRGETPSPASSSDLSPVGRKMMMDVRQQRMSAREAERKKGRFGSRINVQT